MSILFQTPAIVQSIRTLVDGGCKLDIVTRELNPTEMASLFALKNKEGWLLFKEHEIQPSDVEKIPDQPIEEFEKKSPSQRLHDRMFVYYKSSHKDTKNFRDWYSNALDQIGQEYLNKIN